MVKHWACAMMAESNMVDEEADPADALARLEAALDRIAEGARPPSPQAAEPASAEVAERLDALIAQLRDALAGEAPTSEAPASEVMTSDVMATEG